MFVDKNLSNKRINILKKLHVVAFDLISSRIFQKNLSYFSYRDSLTGLKNKRCLDYDLERKLQKKIFFELYFIDIDRLKRINEIFGHITGTKVLEAFSLELHNKLPCGATLYRYGGDEFVVLINCNDAKILTKDFLRNMLSEVEIKVEEKLFNITSSVGKYEWRAQNITAEGILKKADEKMYEEKNVKKYYGRFIN